MLEEAIRPMLLWSSYLAPHHNITFPTYLLVFLLTVKQVQPANKVQVYWLILPV